MEIDADLSTEIEVANPMLTNLRRYVWGQKAYLGIQTTESLQMPSTVKRVGSKMVYIYK